MTIVIINSLFTSQTTILCLSEQTGTHVFNNAKRQPLNIALKEVLARISFGRLPGAELFIYCYYLYAAFE